jgi:predicted metal-dependent phosphoesterase TrpH
LNIDLHIHSTASDGTLTPHEILSLACRLKLGAIAITDHDTLAGSRELLAEEIHSDLHVLSGVEISAAAPPMYPRRGSFHLLGYGIDLDHAELNRTLERLQGARQDRNPKIIRRLNDLGFALTLEEAVVLAGGREGLGRPHLARLMKQKGYVASIEEAFDHYLGHGKPAYVDKFRVECADALRLIRDAGGIPVLAHPGVTLEADTDLDHLLAGLVAMGLGGVEVYYPMHSDAQTRRFAAATTRHGLLMTGGSDFHGSLKPEIQLGVGYGDLAVPFSLYLALADALAAHHTPAAAGDR